LCRRARRESSNPLNMSPLAIWTMSALAANLGVTAGFEHHVGWKIAAEFFPSIKKDWTTTNCSAAPRSVAAVFRDAPGDGRFCKRDIAGDGKNHNMAIRAGRADPEEGMNVRGG
jgi:hypothetical protein